MSAKVGMGFLVVLFVSGLVWLCRVAWEAYRLRDGVRRVKNPAVDIESAFRGRDRVQRRAASIARKARDPKEALLLRIDDEVSGITAEFAARLARPRAVAGILIILGLLITLMNLKVAVEEMQSALQPPTSRSATDLRSRSLPMADSIAPEAQVRRGIAGVASAAGTAFGYSMFAIGLAAILLLVAVGAHAAAAGAIGTFTMWLHDECDQYRQSPREPQDTATKLAFAADALIRVASTFEATNDVLADLKQFSGRLGDAASEISTAVAGLPTQIDGSMAKISNDVAQGIRQGLDHQGAYLESMTTIYAEHGLVLSKTIGILETVAKATVEAGATLVELKALPAEIRRFGESNMLARNAVSALSSSMQVLTTRVEALPAGELAKAARELTDATTRVTSLQRDLAGLRETIATLVQTNVDDATRRNSAALLAELTTLQGLVAKLEGETRTGSARSADELKSGLRKLNDSADRISAANNAESLRAVLAQLARVATAVESLPFVSIKRRWQAIAGFWRKH